MSFFPRKPNPPVPTPAVQVLGANQLSGAGQAPAANDLVEKQAQSNTRFRSFAERYIVERCRDWKEGEIDERAWAAILEAKSIYNKVREVGRTLGDDA